MRRTIFGPSRVCAAASPCGAALLTLLLLLPVATAAGTLYRWVDEDGNVHYSDRMPAGASDEAHSVLDESGTVLDEKDSTAVERQKAREREAREAEERRAAEAAQRELEERRQRDRIIQQTFSTERDIALTRQSRVEAIQVQINITQHGIERLEKQRADAIGRLDRLPEDAPVAESLRERIAQIDVQMERRRENKQRLEGRRAEIEQRFDYYLERFRELDADAD